jgi:glycine/D-amino acid oxidase-like deaminating enzyme
MRIEMHTPAGWWLEEAGEPSPEPALECALDADVVVVGGGFTGMWTAWHLLEADAAARVAILDGDLCGHGPSGRNGGFCESLWLSAPALRARFGDEAARALLDASSETVGRIGAWCAAEGVDAWFDQSGYVCASTAPAFDGVGAAAAAAAAALGAPERVVALDAAAVRARCDSPVLRRGVLIPDFATVQPARLGLGLRRRLLERGATIRERSRVRSLSVERGRVLARTDHGSVRAGAAVLAMGPAARGVRPLRSRLSVASSHVVLTEPVPDVLASLGWTGGECITDGRTLVHYFRTTRDGRIAFGWGGGRPAFGARVRGRAEVDPEVASDVLRALLRVFPALEGRRITHAWGGPVDVSPSHLPQVGSLPGAPVHYAFGFTGNGVGPTHLAGRALAALAARREDPVTRLAIVGSSPGAWVPPEPLAWLGGTLVRSALVRRERIDEAGGRVDPLTLAACAAPRALGIHLGR